MEKSLGLRLKTLGKGEIFGIEVKKCQERGEIFGIEAKNTKNGGKKGTKNSRKKGKSLGLRLKTPGKGENLWD